MGCLHSRGPHQQNSSFENALVSSYEHSLSFSEVNIDIYEVKFNRLLLSSMTAFQGYSKLVESLNLHMPKEFTESVELSFEELGEKSYLCLFIYLLLIGKGENSKRLKVIWYLFDLDMSNKLTMDRIEDLFSCIVASAITFTVNYSIMKSEIQVHSNLIKDWKKKLSDNSANFTKELVSKCKSLGNYTCKEKFIEIVLEKIPIILDLKQTREALDKFTYNKHQ